MNTYARLPVVFERGEGSLLWDSNGKQYIDAISGIAVCSLGHARTEIAEAICDQAHSLLHTSNLYQIQHQTSLAEKLCQLSGMQQVFFSNSGAEANEAAIKLARLYGKNQGIELPEIIVACDSFHGRTLATLSATGNRKVKAGFSPLVQGFVRVSYNDIDAIKNIAKTSRNVVAILLEPVQGEGGVNIPSDDYLTQVRDICDQNDWLLMLDEIQTGMCRTGEWFAFQHNGIKPDVMTLAKALGNGVPIGACLAANKAADVLQPGTHGSTFGGNPLACRAALTVIDIMEKEQLAQAAKQLGDYFNQQFSQQLSNINGVKEVRNKGLMIGIHLNRDCGVLVSQALEQGVLINVAAGNTIRLLPPLTLSTQEADTIIKTVSQLIADFSDAG
jgi:acetylornithine aminotransferase